MMIWWNDIGAKSKRSLDSFLQIKSGEPLQATHIEAVTRYPGTDRSLPTIQIGPTHRTIGTSPPAVKAKTTVGIRFSRAASAGAFLLEHCTAQGPMRTRIMSTSAKKQRSRTSPETTPQPRQAAEVVWRTSTRPQRRRSSAKTDAAPPRQSTRTPT